MKSVSPLAVAAVSLALLSTASGAKPKAVDLSKLPPAAAKPNVTYAADIKPIFDGTCIKCHGAEKTKGKLRLDSLAGALKGGDLGKVIVPGDSANSFLVQAVARIVPEDDAMPPADKAKPLSKDQVALIRAWIDQGAK
ncbi:MAG: hypothetical protein HZA90_04340 [Verrucomicrobia bacterium]|nr:hypothetical protein [Verrucomicrobiota bacterium]